MELVHSADDPSELKKKTQPKTPPTVKKAKKEASLDPSRIKQNEVKAQNKIMIRAALNIASRTKAKKLFVYIDSFDETLIPEKLPQEVGVILVTKRADYTYAGKHAFQDVITIPQLSLGRMGLIKMAVILAMAQNKVNPEDRIVFLLGKTDAQMLDTALCFQISEEQELLTGHSFADVPETVSPSVFVQTLNLAIELGNLGKEGKPVGTIFVLGDEEKVMQLSKQMIINPFKGYDAKERNILNPTLKETFRELSSIDGAFIISGKGEVLAAGRYLGAAMDNAEIPRGLGSRHIAAAGITALTKAIAIVISESTGDVRIFRDGNLIMAIDKPTHK